MRDTATWSRDLEALRASDWPSFVNAHSGLPGPRANLPLVQAVASSADAEVIDALMKDGGEYAAMCAAAAAGRRADESRFLERARALAADDRWRVREGVAIGLQLLGDADPQTLARIVRAWVEDPDPLVQRAAVAAICEPRLLRTPEAAATAIAACGRATQQLAALPREQSRRPDARTLRQTLGYAWSVAVAADPLPGLEAFGDLDVTVTDVDWIVRQNRRKKRLAALLEGGGAVGEEGLEPPTFRV